MARRFAPARLAAYDRRDYFFQREPAPYRGEIVSSGAAFGLLAWLREIIGR